MLVLSFLSLFLFGKWGAMLSLAHHLPTATLRDTNVTSRHLGKVLRECARALSP